MPEILLSHKSWIWSHPRPLVYSLKNRTWSSVHPQDFSLKASFKPSSLGQDDRRVLNRDILPPISQPPNLLFYRGWCGSITSIRPVGREDSREVWEGRFLVIYLALLKPQYFPLCFKFPDFAWKGGNSVTSHTVGYCLTLRSLGDLALGWDPPLPHPSSTKYLRSCSSRFEVL